MKVQSLLISATLIMLSVESYAQFFAPPGDTKFQIALNAGYVQSEIEGSFVDYELNHNLAGKRPELHGKDGIAVEVSANLRIYKFLYFRTGVGYNQQGGEIRHNDVVYPMDIKLGYIHMPVFIGVHLLTLKKLSFAAEGGLQLNQEISPEQNFKKGVIAKNWSTSFIPALSYGICARYKVSARLSVQGSYNYMKALQPFYEHEYFTSRISMNTVAENYSAGVLVSLK